LKKISKIEEPLPLRQYRAANPSGDWEGFREDQQGKSYRAVKKTAVDDQHGLCAYCESSLGSGVERQRIEHFHPKSDRSNPAKNWALDWGNLLAVCMGGSQSAQTDHEQYPTPDNLSCDAYKGHLVNCQRLPVDCEGLLLNPLIMPTANLFRFNKRTGHLEVNEQACSATKYQGENHHHSLAELVSNTIATLNLNCQRLCDARLEVMHDYNRQIKKARETRNTAIHAMLAKRWFSKPWAAFFTTRRYLLGTAAEERLKEWATSS